jgi:hypothetical protein
MASQRLASVAVRESRWWSSEFNIPLPLFYLKRVVAFS